MSIIYGATVNPDLLPWISLRVPQHQAQILRRFPDAAENLVWCDPTNETGFWAIDPEATAEVDEGVRLNPSSLVKGFLPRDLVLAYHSDPKHGYKLVYSRIPNGMGVLTFETPDNSIPGWARAILVAAHAQGTPHAEISAAQLALPGVRTVTVHDR